MKCRHIWIEGPTWKQCGHCGSWEKVKEKSLQEAQDKRDAMQARSLELMDKYELNDGWATRG